jgi:hypothetical protein
MGLFARARSLSRSGPSQIQDIPKPSQTPVGEPAPKSEAAAANLDELLYKISLVPDGVAAPVQLFSLLKEHLRLQVAALLLLDAARQLFVPWCSTGLDTTTRHRLLLPPGLNAPFNQAATGEIALAAGPDLEGFREFFSSRVFALIKRLVLVPFIYNHRLLGLLVVVRLALEPEQDPLSLLQQVAQQASPLLRRLAGRVAEELPGESGLPLPELVQTLFQTAKQKAHPLILMRLQLGSILRQATARYPELEPFRLQEEISSLCQSVFRVIGQVRTLKARQLLVLVHGMKDADPELLRKQLQTIIGANLQELIEPGVLDLSVDSRIIVDDPETALRFIAESD